MVGSVRPGPLPAVRLGASLLVDGVASPLGIRPRRFPAMSRYFVRRIAASVINSTVSGGVAGVSAGLTLRGAGAGVLGLHPYNTGGKR